MTRRSSKGMRRLQERATRQGAAKDALAVEFLRQGEEMRRHGEPEPIVTEPGRRRAGRPPRRPLPLPPCRAVDDETRRALSGAPSPAVDDARLGAQIEQSNPMATPPRRMEPSRDEEELLVLPRGTHRIIDKHHGEEAAGERGALLGREEILIDEEPLREPGEEHVALPGAAPRRRDERSPPLFRRGTEPRHSSCSPHLIRHGAPHQGHRPATPLPGAAPQSRRRSAPSSAQRR